MSETQNHPVSTSSDIGPINTEAQNHPTLPFEEEHTMPKTTVAQLEAVVSELRIQVQQLTDVNRGQTYAMHQMGRNLRGVRAELERLHATNGNKTAHRPKQSTRKPSPAQPSDKKLKCTVPGQDHPEGHTRAELNACWQAHYASKAA